MENCIYAFIFLSIFWLFFVSFTKGAPQPSAPPSGGHAQHQSAPIASTHGGTTYFFAGSQNSGSGASQTGPAPQGPMGRGAATRVVSI